MIAVCVSVVSTGQNINFAVPSNYLYPLILESRVGSVKPLVEDKESQSAASYYSDGEAKFSSGDYVGAIADYDAAIRLSPDYVDAYISRGIAKYFLGDYFAAIVDYNAAVRLNPNEAGAYQKRALAWNLLKQYSRAIEDYDAVIQIAPDWPGVYTDRGNVPMRAMIVFTVTAVLI